MHTEGYTKLAASILTSTIWVESDAILRVWITILALCDRTGYVSGTIPGLANVAKVSVDDCRAAIAKFLGPDLDSRTQDKEGRRLEAVDGGWIVLNFLKYRLQRDPDKRRQQTRIAVQKHREKQKACKPPVSQCKPQKAQSEAEAEAEALIPNTKGPSPSNGLQREFTDGWMERFQNHFNCKYSFQGTKDAVAAAKLVTLETPIKLLEIAQEAWSKTNPQQHWKCVNMSKTIAKFASAINEIRTELTQERTYVNPRNPTGSCL